MTLQPLLLDFLIYEENFVLFFISASRFSHFGFIEHVEFYLANMLRKKLRGSMTPAVNVVRNSAISENSKLAYNAWKAARMNCDIARL